MPLAEPRIGDRTLNLYIPTAPVPPVAIGTQFLATRDGNAGVHYGTIWSLTREVDNKLADIRTYTFRANTHGLLPRVRTVDVTTRLGDTGDGEFLQLVDDPVVRRLRNLYIGKPLWTFGRYVFGCRDPQGHGSSAETRDRAPLHIGAIYRVAGNFVRLPLGTADPLYYCQGGCHQAYHVLTDEPLLVILSPDDHNIQIIPPTEIFHPWNYRGPCVRAMAYFADDWAFERVFTLDDPHVVDPEWSPEARKDLLAYQYDNGMTHRMVAFAAGYPSLFGTRDDLEKLISWEWYPGSTSDMTHYFDENGIFGGGWSWSP